MVSVPRLSEAGLGVTSQWRDSSEASLKPGAVPDPERWKHPSWDWEGAIRIWAQLPASPPDIKAHLFSFASASIFQRATNSTFSLLLRPAVCCSPFWWFYFVYSAGKTGESQVCLETAGNVQIHSAIAPPPGKLWSEIRRNQTLCGKARGKRKKRSLASYDMGNWIHLLFWYAETKEGDKKITSKQGMFVCCWVVFFSWQEIYDWNFSAVWDQTPGLFESPAAGDDMNKGLDEASPYAVIFNPAWQQ